MRFCIKPWRKVFSGQKNSGFYFRFKVCLSDRLYTWLQKTDLLGFAVLLCIAAILSMSNLLLWWLLCLFLYLLSTFLSFSFHIAFFYFSLVPFGCFKALPISVFPPEWHSLSRQILHIFLYMHLKHLQWHLLRLRQKALFARIADISPAWAINVWVDTMQLCSSAYPSFCLLQLP